MATKRVRRTPKRADPPPVQDLEERASGVGNVGGGSPRANTRDEPRKPLGVPRGYVTIGPREGRYSARGAEVWANAGRGVGTPGPQQPRYFAGDEWLPANQGFEAIIEKQQALAIAGYLDPNDSDLRWGKWDKLTREAYKALLSEANAAGLTADQMLSESAMSFANPAGGGGEGGGRGGSWQMNPETGELEFVEEMYTAPALNLRTTSPDDLEAVFRKAVVGLLGEGWSSPQIKELVAAYNWKEIQVQQDAYNQMVAADRAVWEAGGEGMHPGGQVTSEVEMASPENWLEQELIRRDPEGYKAGQIVTNAIPAFMQAIRGWV